MAFVGALEPRPYIAEVRGQTFPRWGRFYLRFAPFQTPQGRKAVRLVEFKAHRLSAFRQGDTWFRRTSRGPKQISASRLHDIMEELADRLHSVPVVRPQPFRTPWLSSGVSKDQVLCQVIHKPRQMAIHEPCWSISWRKVRGRDEYRPYFARYGKGASQGIVMQADVSDEQCRRMIEELYPQAIGYRLIRSFTRLPIAFADETEEWWLDDDTADNLVGYWFGRGQVPRPDILYQCWLPHDLPLSLNGFTLWDEEWNEATR